MLSSLNSTSNGGGKPSKKYLRFEAELHKHVQAIDRIPQSDWASVSGGLTQLQRCIESYKDVEDLPERWLLFTVLNRCLDPQTAMGVHRKAIDILCRVVAMLTVEQRCLNAPLFTVGVFQLFQVASSQIKGDLLSFMEQYIITLPAEALRLILPGLLGAVLCALEESENSEMHRRVVGMLDVARIAVEEKQDMEAQKTTAAAAAASAAVPPANGEGERDGTKLAAAPLAESTAENGSTISKSASAGSVAEYLARDATTKESTNSTTSVHRKDSPPPASQMRSVQQHGAMYTSLWSIVHNVPTMRYPALLYLNNNLTRSPPLTPPQTFTAGPTTILSRASRTKRKKGEKSATMATPNHPVEEDNDDAEGDDGAWMFQPSQLTPAMYCQAHPQLVFESLFTALLDKRERTQRMALDVLIFHFPLHETGVFTINEKAILVAAAIRLLVVTPTPSITRRVLALLNGDSSRVQVFLYTWHVSACLVSHAVRNALLVWSESDTRLSGWWSDERLEGSEQRLSALSQLLLAYPADDVVNAIAPPPGATSESTQSPNWVPMPSQLTTYERAHYDTLSKPLEASGDTAAGAYVASPLQWMDALVVVLQRTTVKRTYTEEVAVGRDDQREAGVGSSPESTSQLTGKGLDNSMQVYSPTPLDTTLSEAPESGRGKGGVEGGSLPQDGLGAIALQNGSEVYGRSNSSSIESCALDGVPLDEDDDDVAVEQEDEGDEIGSTEESNESELPRVGSGTLVSNDNSNSGDRIPDLQATDRTVERSPAPEHPSTGVSPTTAANPALDSTVLRSKSEEISYFGAFALPDLMPALCCSVVHIEQSKRDGFLSTNNPSTRMARLFETTHLELFIAYSHGLVRQVEADVKNAVALDALSSSSNSTAEAQGDEEAQLKCLTFAIRERLRRVHGIVEVACSNYAAAMLSTPRQLLCLRLGTMLCVSLCKIIQYAGELSKSISQGARAASAPAAASPQWSTIQDIIQEALETFHLVYFGVVSILIERTDSKTRTEQIATLFEAFVQTFSTVLDGHLTSGKLGGNRKSFPTQAQPSPRNSGKMDVNDKYASPTTDAGALFGTITDTVFSIFYQLMEVVGGKYPSAVRQRIRSGEDISGAAASNGGEEEKEEKDVGIGAAEGDAAVGDTTSSNQVPLWLSKTVAAAMTCTPTVSIYAAQLYISILQTRTLDAEAYEGLEMQSATERVLRRLWSLVGEHDNVNAHLTNLLIEAYEVEECVPILEGITSELYPENCRHFMALFRLQAEFGMSEYRFFTGLDMMLRALNSTNPSLQLMSRTFLSQSLPYFQRVLNPLLLRLKDSFISLDPATPILRAGAASVPAAHLTRAPGDNAVHESSAIEVAQPASISSASVEANSDGNSIGDSNVPQLLLKRFNADDCSTSQQLHNLSVAGSECPTTGSHNDEVLRFVRALSNMLATPMRPAIVRALCAMTPPAFADELARAVRPKELGGNRKAPTEMSIKSMFALVCFVLFQIAKREVSSIGANSPSVSPPSGYMHPQAMRDEDMLRCSELPPTSVDEDSVICVYALGVLNTLLKESTSFVMHPPETVVHTWHFVSVMLLSLLETAVQARIPYMQTQLLELLVGTVSFLDDLYPSATSVTPVQYIRRSFALSTMGSPLHAVNIAAGMSSSNNGSMRADFGAFGGPYTGGGVSGVGSNASGNGPNTSSPSSSDPQIPATLTAMLVSGSRSCTTALSTHTFFSVMESGFKAAAVAELHPRMSCYGLLPAWKDTLTCLIPYFHSDLNLAACRFIGIYMQVLGLVLDRPRASTTRTLRLCFEGLSLLSSFLVKGYRAGMAVVGEGSGSEVGSTGTEMRQLSIPQGASGIHVNGDNLAASSTYFYQLQLLNPSASRNRSKDPVSWLQNLVTSSDSTTQAVHSSPIEPLRQALESVGAMMMDTFMQCKLSQASGNHVELSDCISRQALEDSLRQLVEVLSYELRTELIQTMISLWGSHYATASWASEPHRITFQSARLLHDPSTPGLRGVSPKPGASLPRGTPLAAHGTPPRTGSPGTGKSPFSRATFLRNREGSTFTEPTSSTLSTAKQPLPSFSKEEDIVMLFFEQCIGMTPVSLCKSVEALLLPIRKLQRAGTITATTSLSRCISNPAGGSTDGSSKSGAAGTAPVPVSHPTPLRPMSFRNVTTSGQGGERRGSNQRSGGTRGRVDNLPYDAAIFRFMAVFISSYNGPEKLDACVHPLLDLLVVHLSSGYFSPLATTYIVRLLYAFQEKERASISRHRSMMGGAGGGGMGNAGYNVSSSSAGGRQRVAALDALRTTGKPAASLDGDKRCMWIMCKALEGFSSSAVAQKETLCTDDIVELSDVIISCVSHLVRNAGADADRFAESAHIVFTRALLPAIRRSMLTLPPSSKPATASGTKQAQDDDSPAIAGANAALQATKALVKLGDAVARRIRSDILESLSNAHFFRVPAELLHCWRAVMRTLSRDRAFHMVTLQQLLPSSTTSSKLAAIVQSQESESIQRAKELKQLSFYVLSAAPTAFDREFMLILRTRITDTIRQYSLPFSLATNKKKRVYVLPLRWAIILFRILLLKVTPAALQSLWSTMIPTVMAILDSRDEINGFKDDVTALVIECVKLLDAAIVLVPNEFQVFRWVFLDDNHIVQSASRTLPPLSSSDSLENPASDGRSVSSTGSQNKRGAPTSKPSTIRPSPSSAVDSQLETTSADTELQHRQEKRTHTFVPLVRYLAGDELPKLCVVLNAVHRDYGAHGQRTAEEDDIGNNNNNNNSSSTGSQDHGCSTTIKHRPLLSLNELEYRSIGSLRTFGIALSLVSNCGNAGRVLTTTPEDQKSDAYVLERFVRRHDYYDVEYVYCELEAEFSAAPRETSNTTVKSTSS